MAPTTISLARVMELKVPIVWQEAVEVVRALEAAAAEQGALITLEHSLISTDGSVVLDSAGPAHGVLSPLQVLGELLDGATMPQELRNLISSDADALSAFPSEGDTASKTVTLDWFSRPDGGALIGRLATRAVAGQHTKAAVGPGPAVAAPALLPSPGADYWPQGAFAPASPAFVPKPRQAEPEWAHSDASAPVATAPPSSAPVQTQPRAAQAAQRPVQSAPRPSVQKTSPALPVVEASRSSLARGISSLQTALVPTANTLLEQLRNKVSQLPALREQVSTAVGLRENLPAGATGVTAAATAVALIMVVAAWAWLPARAEMPTIAARGPVLVGSAVINFAVPAVNVSPSAYLASIRSRGKETSASGAVGTREPEAVATVGSWSVFSPAGPGSSTVFPSNGSLSGSPSSGNGTELAAPTDSVAPVTMAAEAAAPPQPAAAPAVRANTRPPSANSSSSMGRTPAAAPVDRRIYSAADENVEPPSMLRLQMPSEPKPGELSGNSWMEVLVDERGQVAQVRVHSSNLSLNDRMIVSAAKAWQFQPALKDGNPVKYVLRMPILR